MTFHRLPAPVLIAPNAQDSAILAVESEGETAVYSDKSALGSLKRRVERIGRRLESERQPITSRYNSGHTLTDFRTYQAKFMANFLGEFDCKLDSKMRIALPVALRKQLPVEAEGRFVVNRGFEQHLVLYPATEWRRVTAELDRLNPYVKKNRDFVRYFHRGATELELDGSGRLLLPRRLLDYAGIRDAVILLAYAQRIECWDPTLYENLLSDEPADFARLAEDIMGGAGRSERDGERFPDFRDLPPMPPGSRH